MVEYRFVTPNRVGKWYRSLRDAQRYACRIGAGFLNESTRQFVAYPGVQLQCRERALEPARQPAGRLAGKGRSSGEFWIAPTGQGQGNGGADEARRFHIASQNDSFASAEQVSQSSRFLHVPVPLETLVHER